MRPGRWALARVRDLLGQDAIIVTTQDLKQGGVRVTAAMDEDDLDLADLLAPVERAGAPPWLIDLAEHHDLAPALVTGLEQALAGAIDVDPAVALDRALQQMFRFAPLPPASPTPLLLLGPPGGGKTVSIAKIAARGVLGKGRVEVITADVARAGGQEQLETLLRPLGLRARPAGDLDQLRAADR
ncbi:MAG TPA: hypothetical protein VFZ01_07675 [Geminicoccaceae bacterium]